MAQLAEQLPSKQEVVRLSPPAQLCFNENRKGSPEKGLRFVSLPQGISFWTKMGT